MANEIITDVGESGIITQFEIVSKDAFNVKRTQDVSKILDMNKADQADSSFNDGYTEEGDMKHVARVPLLVLEQWAKKHNIAKKDVYGKEMNDIIRKELNDPDNKFLRTGGGEL